MLWDFVSLRNYLHWDCARNRKKLIHRAKIHWVPIHQVMVHPVLAHRATIDPVTVHCTIIPSATGHRTIIQPIRVLGALSLAMASRTSSSPCGSVRNGRNVGGSGMVGVRRIVAGHHFSGGPCWLFSPGGPFWIFPVSGGPFGSSPFGRAEIKANIFFPFSSRGILQNKISKIFHTFW